MRIIISLVFALTLVATSSWAAPASWNQEKATKIAAELATAIDGLLRNPEERARLAALGPPRARRFSVKRMVDAYEQLYLKVLLR